MKYIKRIISAPFIFGILLVAHNWFVLKRVLMFLKYGGECTVYDKNDLKTIQDIYQQIKNKPNEQH